MLCHRQLTDRSALDVVVPGNAIPFRRHTRCIPVEGGGARSRCTACPRVRRRIVPSSIPHSDASGASRQRVRSSCMTSAARRLFVICLLRPRGRRPSGRPRPSPRAASTSTLSGTVTDTSGAVIPGASVIVKNVADTAVTSEAVTNAEGQFTVPQLNAGKYSVIVTPVGLQDRHRQRRRAERRRAGGRHGQDGSRRHRGAGRRDRPARKSSRPSRRRSRRR